MNKQKSIKGYLSTSSIYFFYFFAMAVFGSMLSVYLSSGGKTTGEISFIVSGAGLFTMIAQPFIGILYDRTGWRKRLSVILLVFLACMGVIFAFTQSTPALFILFTVTAVLTCLGFHWTGLEDTPSKQAEKGPRQKAVLSLPLILFMVFCFIFSGLTGASSTYVPLLLQEKLGGTSVAGTVLFFATMMEIPIIFLSDRFMDKLSGQQLLALNTLLLVVQTALMDYQAMATRSAPSHPRPQIPYTFL